MLMAKRKTGKKVECFTIELCILSLARLSLKKKRDTCNAYILNRQKKKTISDYTWYIVFLHNKHLQPRRDAKGHALKRNPYQL